MIQTNTLNGALPKRLKTFKSMSKNHKHDMAAVLDALDHSDGDVDHPQEILVELQEGFPAITSAWKEDLRKRVGEAPIRARQDAVLGQGHGFA
ncbi:MAG: hypothetical protein CM15mP77_1420 [Synechococcus sp.]|nr:MAG: hypothetical protein CM15mP77_1420 [Synechococcus sp.]